MPSRRWNYLTAHWSKMASDSRCSKTSSTVCITNHLTISVVDLSTVLLHGVWRGTDLLAWQRERLNIDCRSLKVESKLEVDLSIVEP